MKILQFSADRFRNLSAVSFKPDPGMNVIYGENGQGKTNIIESIWLFTGCYSFRTRKNQQLVCDREKDAVTSVDFFSNGREQNAVMTIAKRKQIVLNGVQNESPRAMLGKFYAVVFSPSVLSVVQDGPSERRKLLDIAISLIRPNYAMVMAKYLRSLDQRNALLRNINEKNLSPKYLDMWDEELIKYGSEIVRYRLEYIENLRGKSALIYDGISSGRERFDMKYDFVLEDDNEDVAEKLRKELEKSRESDIRRLYTAAGPHGHDLYLSLDGRDARIYGSQGQQRSCALAMKLGEADIISEICGEEPVVLLDDVMSELDEGRQNYILNYLGSRQVFITCCDPSQVLRSATGKCFEVKDGRIAEMDNG